MTADISSLGDPEYETIGKWLAPIAIALIVLLGFLTTLNVRGLQGMSGFAVAGAAILIAALWYPRLAMILVGAILLPAGLWGAQLLADSEPVDPWTNCYATSPPQTPPPGAGFVEVDGRELTCIGGEYLRVRSEVSMQRRLAILRAGMFGIALAGLMIIWWRPRTALLILAGAPVGLFHWLLVVLVNNPD